MRVTNMAKERNCQFLELSIQGSRNEMIIFTVILSRDLEWIFEGHHQPLENFMTWMSEMRQNYYLTEILGKK